MNKALIITTAVIMAACTRVPSQINNDQVFFAYDSAEISDKAAKKLHGQALYMKKNPDVNIVLAGYCDERGSTEYNMALGALRAGNAAHVFIKDGVDQERIKTISYGKNNPQYPGTGEEVWAKNRNVTTNVTSTTTEK